MDIYKKRRVLPEIFEEKIIYLMKLLAQNIRPFKKENMDYFLKNN